MDGIMDIATETGLYPYDYTLLKFYKNLGNNNIVFQDSTVFQPLCFGGFEVADFHYQIRLTFFSAQPITKIACALQ
ncbi:MAG: hypothetical protein R2764_15675 [Bacteroidales bacterium]